MTHALRQNVLSVLLVAALAFGALWAKQTYDQDRQQLESVAKETADCREIVASIHRLRGAAIPVDTDMPEEQLYQCLHESARLAGVDDGQVIRSITPQPARLVRGSSVQQKDVDLQVQGMTMQQLVLFLHHLHAAHAQLQVSAMTLRDAKGLGLATLWNVEPLVLTYQIKASTKPTIATASNR
jgi:hypothetical protein